eukprot:GILJ01000245.1.p1 GENE.GILJ01000245.1~~GILJ01000245.1.p1  ORF type:complete len:317 (-),score=49.80 GILJ01000245.1:142-1092(-)
MARTPASRRSTIYTLTLLCLFVATNGALPLTASKQLPLRKSVSNLIEVPTAPLMATSFLETASAARAPIPGGNVTINGDITVTGQLSCQTIKARNLTVMGTMTVTEQLNAAALKTDLLSTDAVEVATIRSPSGTVTVDGDLSITSVIASSVSASFLQMNGVVQWQLASHDDFDSLSSQVGWSRPDVSSCPGSPNKFLGGHCKFSSDEISKTYKGLAAHSSVRITARFHMLDNWNGESAFMKINGQTVWLDSAHKPSHATGALNMCGGDHADPKFSVPIDVTIPHIDDKVTVAFGSSLTGDSCDQSWGVDDVMVYVK